MKLKFSRKFSKQYNKAGIRIQAQVDHKLKLFSQDPYNPILNNHSLTGNYSGFRSINVNGDWRAIYSEYTNKEDIQVIVFELLGTHSQLYS